MQEKYKIIHSPNKNKESLNENTELLLNLSRNRNELPKSRLNEVISSNDIFNAERDESTLYRINAEIDIIASNVLVNLEGDYSYETVLKFRNYDEDDEVFEFTTDEILKEENGWFYVLTGDTLNACKKEYLEPVPEKLIPANFSGQTNYDFFITYPYDYDQSTTFNDVPLSDGIALFSGKTVTINNRSMIVLYTSIAHNLSINDEIKIESTSIVGIEGFHQVYKLGNENNDYLDNAFVIDVNVPILLSFANTETKFKKYTEGIPSEYYLRKFKKITRITDVDFYKNGFAQNAFNDQNFGVTFTQDVDIDGLTDYLGRPVSELYFTIIKKPLFDNNQNFFTLLQSGIDTIIAFSDYDINTITIPNNDALESNINSNLEWIYGDIVEWNPVLQRQSLLEDIHHRFNTSQRLEYGFYEGFFYKPHYLFTIKEFTDYILDANELNDSVPDYASIIKSKYFWRDVVSNSDADNLDIPFVNDRHYIFYDILCFLNRQDPCLVYNLGQRNPIEGICDNFEDIEEKPIFNIC
jgi:hypothetical protein